MTGDWQSAAERLQANELSRRWRPFKVTKIVDESASIRSFHLMPDDGAGLLPHQAGQHLPIRVQLPGTDKPLIRHYTLSVAPSDGFYRISVKRDGVVSHYLHDHLQIGDSLEMRAPAGDFTIDAQETRPAVLIAAGVGITPMLAMLRHLVYEGRRKQRMRPTYFIQSARNKAERPFVRELDALLAASQGACKMVRVLSQPEDAELGFDYDVAGRIDMALLSRCCPLTTTTFTCVARRNLLRRYMTGCAAITSRIAVFTPKPLARPRCSAAWIRSKQNKPYFQFRRNPYP